MQKSSKVISIVLGIAIGVVIFLVVILGIKTLYPEPVYEDSNYGKFTGQEKVYTPPTCSPQMTVQDCQTYQSQETQKITVEQQKNQAEIDVAREEWNAIQDNYNKNVFLIANLAAIILIAIAILLTTMVNIGAGLTLAGVALIIYGYSGGWRGTPDNLKFFVGLIIAAIIIVFGVIINKRQQRSENRT